MAAKASRYGRRLIVFMIAILAMYGLVAVTPADWEPKLGLDLQGGTRITLQAKTPDGGDAPADQLEEARTLAASGGDRQRLQVLLESLRTNLFRMWADT